MQYKFVLGLFLVMMAPCGILRGQSDRVDQISADSISTTDLEKVFKWFDTLGYPKLADRKLISVPIGSWSNLSDDSPKINYGHAFLLRDEGERLGVFMLNLSEHTFEKTPDGVSEHGQLGFAVADLKKIATDRLTELRKISDEEPDPWRRFGAKMTERGELFVLARACNASGYKQLANELVAQALSIRDRQTGKRLLIEALQEKIAEDISHAEMWRAVVAFGNPEISRKELLQRFREIEKHFPKSRHVKRAKETADILAKMVKEDESHAATKRKSFDKMTTKEQVAELIFQLRDQNGRQWSQPGSCNIFADPRDGGPFGHAFGEKDSDGGSPASQLVAIGYEAIPQLIENLEDPRLTRSVGFHRNFYFSHHVLSVGNCAMTIVNRISSQSFHARSDTARAKEGEERQSTVRVRKWWAEVQRKGIQQALVDGVVVGDDNSPLQAEQLIQKYPDVALIAITKGARNSKSPWTRSSLVTMAAGIKGDGPNSFLVEEMRKAPSMRTRVAAAVGLLDRNHAEAIPAMIEEWRKLIGDSGRKRAPRNDEWVDSVELLISFLAECGQPSAIKALTNNFDQHSVGRRLAIVSAFGSSSNFGLSSDGGEGVNPGAGGEASSGKVRQAIVGLLIGALQDTEERLGMSGSWDGKPFDDPRVCDIAGHVLNSQWHNDFRFDLSASLFERDQQRIALINVWRKDHKMQLLPLPKRKVIPRLPRGKVDPALQAIVVAKNKLERRKAVEAYRALGLPALPSLNENLIKLAKDHPAAAEMKSLAARMACIVDDIQFERKSVKPDNALSQRLQRLLNKPLTSKALVDTLIATAENLPKGAVGVRLTANRSGDDTGIIITVMLPKERVFDSGSQKGWSTSTRVSVGKESLLSSSGSSSLDYGVTVEAHQDLMKSLETALTSPPDKPIIARVSMVLEE